MRVLEYFIHHNKKSEGFKLVPWKEMIGNNTRGKKSKNEASIIEKKNNDKKINLPFAVLELKTEPKINSNKNTCIIDLQKKWSFDQLLYHF